MLRGKLLSLRLPKDSICFLLIKMIKLGKLSFAASDPEPQADFASLPSGPKQKSFDADASFAAQAVS